MPKRMNANEFEVFEVLTKFGAFDDPTSQMPVSAAKTAMRSKMTPAEVEKTIKDLRKRKLLIRASIVVDGSAQLLPRYRWAKWSEVLKNRKTLKGVKSMLREKVVRPT